MRSFKLKLMRLKKKDLELTLLEAELFEEKEHQANSRELLVLICLLTFCIFVLGNLYRSYDKSQNHLGPEVSNAIGVNQKLEAKHAPEIGY